MSVREVKSNVFSMLMQNKKYALAVYNVLNGSDYKNVDELEIITLEKGISLSVRNDAGFILDGFINLYEHQSTYNPNMALRMLYYLCDSLHDWTEKYDIYGSKVIQIPTPHFCVFYNGLQPRPPVEYVRLSSSYTRETDEPELELICKVININPGANDDMLSECRVLYEYTRFVEMTREHRRRLENLKADDFVTASKEEKEVLRRDICRQSVEAAIEQAISEHILEEFLRSRRNEVLEVMTIDMTFEAREPLIRQAGYEDGFKDGELQGELRGVKLGEKRGEKRGAQKHAKIMYEKMITDGMSREKAMEYSGYRPQLDDMDNKVIR